MVLMYPLQNSGDAGMTALRDESSGSDWAIQAPFLWIDLVLIPSTSGLTSVFSTFLLWADAATG